MAHESILIVEDEQDIMELIAYNLRKEGYAILQAPTGEKALAKVEEHIPDLLILDLMLPGIDGIEICRQLKRGEKTRNIPIIMVTAKSEDSDIITGFEMGADDYITKPFSPKVLIARIRTVLRRNHDSFHHGEEKLIHINGIEINPARHTVHVEGEEIILSATEFAILEFLAANPGWVFSRNQIIKNVKGNDYPVTERSVDVQILGLRKKLGPYGETIQTVRGVGYRMKGIQD